jgi:putative ATP-dependent endonuclease of the OLD family
MRIARAHIVNFRCLSDLRLEFDDVTVLVGANSTGKSTVLHALRWFFEGGPLEPEDFSGCQPDAVVSVSMTFTNFTSADREALGSYVVGEEATFWRTYSVEQAEKLTGRGQAYPAFEEIRKHNKAIEKRKAYNDLRATHPELALPTASSQQAVDEAMRSWESEHPDALEESRVSATHLFGFTGGSRLNGRFDFVLVPAVSDPEAETRDGRGTLLRQLLDRAVGDQLSLDQRLKALEEATISQMQEIMEAEGGATLKELAKEISDELARLVPAGSVILEPQQPAIRLPSLGVTLRIAEGGLETAVGRQGHGFQRALLIAIVQQLAGTRPPEADPAGEVAGEQRPALFLALEEPELYQHPVQARHFASSLAALASGESVQVAYATHSEHFVDPARYERLRRFRRRSNSQWPVGDVTQATITGVTQRLQGTISANEVATRIRITLRRQIAEAVFARAVLIVEGHTDAGFFQGIADRDGGLDADGIAVVVAGGKTNLLIPRAILEELAVPTFVVFDGDASQAMPHTPRDNEKLLRGLGATPQAYPPTHVEEKFASFHDDLEAETSSWDGYSQQQDVVRAELGDWRDKSEDVNRSAAAATPAEPPKVFTDIIQNLRALV